MVFFLLSLPLLSLSSCLPAQCSLQLSCHLGDFLSSPEPEPSIFAVPPPLFSFFPQISPATTKLQSLLSYQCFSLHLPILFHSNYFPPLYANWLPFSFLLFWPCFSYCLLFFLQVPQILLFLISIIMTYLILFLLLSGLYVFQDSQSLNFKYPFCTFFHFSILSISFQIPFLSSLLSLSATSLCSGSLSALML